MPHYLTLPPATGGWALGFPYETPPHLHNAIWDLPWPGDSVGWSIIPIPQKVVGSIPGQGTYLGFRFNILGQGMYGRELMDFCLSLSVSLSLSLINKHTLW